MSKEKEKITIGRFTISERSEETKAVINDGKSVIWIETNEGEGTEVDLDKLFEWAM